MIRVFEHELGAKRSLRGARQFYQRARQRHDYEL